MVASPGRLSLYCFLPAASIAIGLLITLFCPQDCSIFVDNFLWIALGHYVLINIYLRLFLRGYSYQVAIRATFLGIIFAVGIYVAFVPHASWCVFGCYMCVMSIFHFSEFVTTAFSNPKTLSLDSFLLNHSVAYGAAAITSWLEFFVERWLLPDMKLIWPVAMVGGIFCIGGEILRKVAMVTAGTNFNHIVQSVREDGHQLVTHGVYNVFRHPSYVGWFYWSIGTQLLLLNPLCLIAYILASWKFFYERVLVEEITLLNFFGEQYYQYQQRVRTGLPFIDGYRGSD